MEICIIKLGAKGDVIRTLPVMREIKKQNENSSLTLITQDNIKDLLANLPYLDRISTIPYKGKEKFDVLYNFDIEEEATELVEKIESDFKYGLFKKDGFVSAFNLGAEYYLNTLFDDVTKKTNKKTYQEMMFEAAELKSNKEHAGIVLEKQDLEYCKKFLSGKKINEKNLIGIHMGASPRWPSKIWHEDNLKDFIKLVQRKDYRVLLFGGLDEIERQKRFVSELEKEGIHVFMNNPLNTDRQFASLLSVCKAIICSDSFALHLSLALGKQTIGLFFCTPPDEVESYGLLKKIVSPMLRDFFPEKMNVYNEALTKSIPAEDVFNEIDRLKTL